MSLSQRLAIRANEVKKLQEQVEISEGIQRFYQYLLTGRGRAQYVFLDLAGFRIVQVFSDKTQLVQPIDTDMYFYGFHLESLRLLSLISNIREENNLFMLPQRMLNKEIGLSYVFHKNPSVPSWISELDHVITKLPNNPFFITTVKRRG